MRKDHGGDQFVAGLGCHSLKQGLVFFFAAKDAIAQASSGGNGHGSQFHLAANVAERKNMGHRRVLIFVHDNVLVPGVLSNASALEVHAVHIGFRRGVERHIVNVRHATGRHENNIAIVNHVAAKGGDLFLAIGLEFHLGDAARVAVNVDTVLFHLLVQETRNVGVKVTKGLFLAQDQVRFRSQSVQDTGQFHTNVSSSHHHRLFGLLRQLKKSIAGNGMFNALNLGIFVRFAARGNENVRGRDLLRTAIVLDNLDRVVVDKTAKSVKYRHARFFQSIQVDIVESGNVLVALVLEFGPIQLEGILGFLDGVKIVHFGIFQQRLSNVRGLEHDLFGYAADIDAGSTQAVAFNDAHLFAVVNGRALGRGNTSGTAANHQVIEIVRRRGIGHDGDVDDTAGGLCD
mmetsp:Transcript_4884/g.13697  ORF Transcript_4884/g.13697 Transcript_4884/m.13697 type:complete len:402 (+) Transcript_4884:635-1840(+)